MKKYDDITNLPHYTSKRHPWMSPSNRTTPFPPFAALPGMMQPYRKQQTACPTDSFVELDEDKKDQLDVQLHIIRENLKQKSEYKITYFQLDEKKNGRSYETIHGRIRKIYEFEQQIIFKDGKSILIKHINGTDATYGQSNCTRS